MSFHIIRIGKPGNVGAALREEAKKLTKNMVGVDVDAVTSAFESAAQFAEQCSGQWVDGINPAAIYASVAGHFGTQPSLTIEVRTHQSADLPVEDPEPTAT